MDCINTRLDRKLGYSPSSASNPLDIHSSRWSLFWSSRFGNFLLIDWFARQKDTFFEPNFDAQRTLRRNEPELTKPKKDGKTARIPTTQVHNNVSNPIELTKAP